MTSEGVDGVEKAPMSTELVPCDEEKEEMSGDSETGVPSVEEEG